MYTIVAENIGNDSRTTIMIRNIPNKYTVDDLSREIDEQHSNTYDFLYLPCDLKVLPLSFRTNAMLGMGLLTSRIQKI